MHAETAPNCWISSQLTKTCWIVPTSRSKTAIRRYNSEIFSNSNLQKELYEKICIATIEIDELLVVLEHAFKAL